MPHQDTDSGSVDPWPSIGIRRRLEDDVLTLAPRKKPRVADPLVHHGRHFGRTVHQFCNVQPLITNGLLRMGELADEPDEFFTGQQRREFRVFKALLLLVPGLEERLVNGSEEDAAEIAEMIQKGALSARSDDTKSLKGTILDWITPRDQPLRPPLTRNGKADRGFNHEITGALLCPIEFDWSDPQIKEQLRSGILEVAGDQWPTFLFADCRCDPERPWDGFLRNRLLLSGFKHIFTSPSSVEKETKATRSGNARLHGMTNVTPASIVYVATQIRFALCSSSIFSRTDQATDSEGFYNSLLDFLDSVDEQAEVHHLLTWWNRQIFPSYTISGRYPKEGTALHRFKAHRHKILVSASAMPNQAFSIT